MILIMESWVESQDSKPTHNMTLWISLVGTDGICSVTIFVFLEDQIAQSQRPKSSMPFPVVLPQHKNYWHTSPSNHFPTSSRYGTYFISEQWNTLHILNRKGVHCLCIAAQILATFPKVVCRSKYPYRNSRTKYMINPHEPVELLLALSKWPEEFCGPWRQKGKEVKECLWIGI